MATRIGLKKSEYIEKWAQEYNWRKWGIRLMDTRLMFDEQDVMRAMGNGRANLARHERVGYIENNEPHVFQFF